MILSLPLSLPDATPIGDQHAMQTRAGITYYFYNLQPYDCHPAGDRRAMLLRAAKLQVVSRVRQRDLMRAFQVSRPTVARAVRRYREHGEDAFYEPLRRRGRTVVDAELADKATNLLASGMSGNACARRLGIAATTFKANRRAGVIVDPARTHTGSVDAPQTAPVADHAPSVDAPQTHQAPPADRAPSVDAPQTHQAPPADRAPSVDAPQTHQAPPTDRATRDARDKQAPMGRAARDVEGRTLASAGLMTEATPVFVEPANAVAYGGVLETYTQTDNELIKRITARPDVFGENRLSATCESRWNSSSVC